MSPPRPIVVWLTGEPGSGKTTLGTALARELGLPFLCRDDVRWGRFVTDGAFTDEPGQPLPHGEATELFVSLVESVVRAGVSCVVEYVVRREADDAIGRLDALADVLVVVTSSPEAPSRRRARTTADNFRNRVAVLAALGDADPLARAARVAAQLAEVTRTMSTEFDQPTLRVDTTAVTDDLVSAVVAFVTSDESGSAAAG